VQIIVLCKPLVRLIRKILQYILNQQGHVGKLPEYFPHTHAGAFSGFYGNALTDV
jgi:hypothetical protein